MADGLNQCTFIGNLGADPELRGDGGDRSVLKMRIAVTNSWIDRDDKKQERTEWVSIAVFGRRGEGLAKILSKGDRVCVVGRMQTSEYEKDGEKRYSTEIVANDVVLCGGGKGRDDGERGGDRRESRSDNRGSDRGRDDRGRGGGNDRGNDRKAPSNGYGGGSRQSRGRDDDFGGFPAGDDDIPFIVDRTMFGNPERP
jgi:single-strand DNA-binding protein